MNNNSQTAETIVTEDATAAPMVTLMHDTQEIPLSKLVASKKNVRKRNAAMTIPELAASIEAHGLIQNLTVRKTAKGNKFEVVAGSRRFAALLHLVAQGRIDKATLIPCNVRAAADNDTEISLAENTQRHAMHICDEILAYRQLAEDGMTPDTIAARFGQSVVTVRQRLKLAALSPKIIGVLREDGMTIEQARALAISDDHAAQEQAWFDVPPYNRTADVLRCTLVREHVRSTDKLAKFVGIEAYEAAGGAVMRDLFSDEGTTYLADRPLLVALATERLEREARIFALKGWKWAESSLEASALYNGGFTRIFPVAQAPTENEEAELARLDAQYDEIDHRLENYAEDDPAIEADEAELARIGGRMDEIRSALKLYDTQEKALAGCIVTINHSGALQIETGLVRPDDLDALCALHRPETAGSETGEDGEGASAGNAPALSAGGKHGDDDADEQPMAYSATLVEELTAIRTAAMRNELANRPNLALAVMLYPLVLKVFLTGRSYWRIGSAVEVSGQVKDLAPSIREPDACDALTGWTRIHETWGYKLPGNPGDLWEWLLEQDQVELLELLAVVTAANINAVEAKHDHDRERLAHADQLAAALKLDMNGHWEAKAAFLSRLSKAQIAEVMEDAGCAKSAIKAAGKAPKGEAVALAEKALEGKAWLPAVLRSPIEDDAAGEAPQARAAE